MEKTVHKHLFGGTVTEKVAALNLSIRIRRRNVLEKEQKWLTKCHILLGTKYKKQTRIAKGEGSMRVKHKAFSGLYKFV